MSAEYKILKVKQPTVKLPTVTTNGIELEELKVNLLEEVDVNRYNEELMQQGPLNKQISGLPSHKIGYQSP
jgi:hypothetical protein